MNPGSRGTRSYRFLIQKAENERADPCRSLFRIAYPRIRDTIYREMRMASPLCTICEGSEDAMGRPSCRAFPLGIPQAIYPWGCSSRGTSGPGFMPGRGLEETARRWAELDGEELSPS
jgi:hypothetical protein